MILSCGMERVEWWWTHTKNWVAIVVFYVASVGLMCYLEDISVVDSVYMITTTITTVGYGDVSPSTKAGRLVMCVVIAVGIYLIFDRIARYAALLHAGISVFQRRFFAALGIQTVSISDLPVTKHPPSEVNALLNYKRRYFFAWFPLLFMFAVAFLVNLLHLDLSVIDALYLTFATLSTVGYGDVSPTNVSQRIFSSVFLLVFVVVASKTISDVVHVSLRRRIRRGEGLPDLERCLLDKAAAGVVDDVVITESDYIVETLRSGHLVDEHILVAIRRHYFWLTPRRRLDAHLLHAQIGGGMDFDDWWDTYWKPKVTRARAAAETYKRRQSALDKIAFHYIQDDDDDDKGGRPRSSLTSEGRRTTRLSKGMSIIDF
ncbi:hypothetical protein CTAYLR_003551 [Chrysophaeum taylorii]|uniref:Potassium channel domain-containing protein n=1 Tax=Chrysophaeum taylorii TaxID=2483200 RepID=A0AAD7UMM6_9STRA|nr:hypothetical protein CTAYLR_003551 [Chrysophaeum taylorii]